jgi:protocatechuate 3,4-dioxygenase beta subunit
MSSKPSVEETLEAAVLARIANDTDGRFKTVMSAVIRHLHALVREVELTEQEWFEAIKFLTATGKKCDDKRQEFILLSDVLGISMLVDAINHRREEAATQNTVLGPFFVHGAPEIQNGGDMGAGWTGEPTFVSGRVVSTDGKAVAGATLDLWQSNDEGFYDVQLDDFDEHKLRAKLKTDAQGRYWFRTIKPTSYPVPTDGPVGLILDRMGRHPMRPAHLHVAVTAPGYETLVTHLFVKGDPYIESDVVFGVKPSLIVDFRQNPSEEAAQKAGLKAPFCEASYDFVLKAAEGNKLQTMIAPSDAVA